MDCNIVGDSIAVGIGMNLSPQCNIIAKVGRTSIEVVRTVTDADLVIVSVGSNDPLNLNLLKNLLEIRKKLTGRVIWILPIHERARAAVRLVAFMKRDPVISFTPGPDNVHPKNYKTVSNTIIDYLAKS